MDTLTVEERSRNMSAIRSKDTKPEVYLRKLLFAEGLRYRKNAAHVYGHPDLYLAKYHAAVFIHGCFWHRHPGCRFAYTPKSRVDFWKIKFSRNILREVKAVVKNAKTFCYQAWSQLFQQLYGASCPAADRVGMHGERNEEGSCPKR